MTDCNVMLGKLQPENFPAVFGDTGDRPIDADIVRTRFGALAEEIATASGKTFSEHETAQGFIAVAVENMAAAIKRISVERGYDVSRYTLCCFGGAGAQHACLGLLHPQPL